MNHGTHKVLTLTQIQILWKLICAILTKYENTKVGTMPNNKNKQGQKVGPNTGQSTTVSNQNTGTANITSNMTTPQISVQQDGVPIQSTHGYITQSHDLLYGTQHNIQMPGFNNRQNTCMSNLQYIPPMNNVQNMPNMNNIPNIPSSPPVIPQQNQNLLSYGQFQLPSADRMNQADKSNGQFQIITMLQNLDTRLGSIEGHLGQQNNKMANFERQMVNIEQSVQQIGGIKQKLASVQTQMQCIENEVSAVKMKMTEYDQNIQGYSDICDDVLKARTQSDKVMETMCEKIDYMQTIEMDRLQTLNDQMNEKLIDLQCHSMRENLIFTGIDEPNLPPGQFENVENTIKDFVRNQMNIESDVRLDSAFRQGPYNPRKQFPRIIIAKFENYSTREMVKSAAPRTLEGTKYGVREQFPREVEIKRKVLYPMFKRVKQNPQNRVRLFRDRLYINGELYMCDQNNQPVKMQQNVDNLGQTRSSAPSQQNTQYAQVVEKPNRNYSNYQSQHVRTAVQNPPTRLRAWQEIRQMPNNWSTARGRGLTNNAQPQGFQTPTSNSFSSLLNTEQDNPRPWPGKKKATSPLEAEASSKKQRDNNLLTAEPISNDLLNTESAATFQHKRADQMDDNNPQSEDHEDHSNLLTDDNDIEEHIDPAMEIASNENPQQTKHGETQTQSNIDETRQLPPNTD